MKKLDPAAWAWPAAVGLGLAALFCWPQPAGAAIDCWMDAEHARTADSRPVADAAAAPMRAALQAVNALLHRQPELHALPRSRLRSSWQVGGQWDAPARSGSLLLREHRESMWEPGRCAVKPGADRLGPKASVVVRINAPTAFFESEHADVSDEQLQAWRELPQTGELQGRTLYGGNTLVFTRGGRLPWVAVTQAEYIGFTLRELRRQQAEAAQAGAGLPPEGDWAAREAFDEAQLRKIAEGLRQSGVAGAEQMLAELRAQQRASREADRVAAQRRAARGVDPSPLLSMIRRVEAWRDSLSPVELAAQARLGMNGLHDPALPAERYPRLARPDPAYPWDRQQPARPQMIKLQVMGGDVFEQPMQQVLQRLDLRALQALVD